MIPRTPGVYSITNQRTGDQYVGSTVNLEKREREHFWALRRGSHYNKHLQRAFIKYGEESFFFRPELFCARDELDRLEQQQIDQRQPKYNKYGAVRPRGYKPPTTAEAREKMAAAKRGVARAPFTAETRARMSAAQKKTPRKPLTPEQEVVRLEALRAAVKGKPKSAEHRAKISEAQKGRPKSPEQIARMRLMRPSPEARAKMSAAAKRRRKA